MTETVAVSLAAIAIVALCLWLERATRIGRRVGSAMLVIAVAALLSNTGVMPESSAVYDFLGGWMTSLAIVWLVMSVDLRQLRDAGRPMLLAFGAAVLATALGAVVAVTLFRGELGDDAAGLAGVLTGTYSGGSLNFVAVSREVEIGEEMKIAAYAADNVMTAVWMGVTLAFPVLLRRVLRPVPLGALDAGAGEGAAASTPGLDRSVFRPVPVLLLLMVGVATVTASEELGQLGGEGSWMAKVPGVVWLTTLALIVGLVPSAQAVRPTATAMGTLGLLGFFVIIGVFSRVAKILDVGLHVFWVTALVIGVHGALLVLAGRLLRLDVGTVAVASQAAVGGPSTAVALAHSKGWRGLVLPGTVVGLLGYAVGTYAGVLVAGLMG